LGAVLGALAGAYIGGAMSNGSLNPGDWNFENPSTWLGMIGGGMLGNSIEMSMVGASGNLTDSYSGKGSVERSTDGMDVVREKAIPSNDLEKLAGQKLSEHVDEMQSPWNKFLGHDRLEYKIGASTSGKYEIVAGGSGSVTTPRSWIDKYDILMHSHPVGTGASTPSAFAELAHQSSDYSTARAINSLGFKGEYALYVPDTRMFFGYNSVYSNGMATNSYWELLNVLR
jgi:hypothetical protein